VTEVLAFTIDQKQIVILTLSLPKGKDLLFPDRNRTRGKPPFWSHSRRNVQ
jgi:hypothetical protein